MKIKCTSDSGQCPV